MKLRACQNRHALSFYKLIFLRRDEWYIQRFQNGSEEIISEDTFIESLM